MFLLVLLTIFFFNPLRSFILFKLRNLFLTWIQAEPRGEEQDKPNPGAQTQALCGAEAARAGADRVARADWPPRAPSLLGEEVLPRPARPSAACGKPRTAEAVRASLSLWAGDFVNKGSTVDPSLKTQNAWQRERPGSQGQGAGH